ncbi:uncharacterized protein [Nicotiana sylvestris]|uniref:uncharacterized protein n=1 Tax=Nicotiana sylvestris TaxID=4096 RepID=UPI00388CC2B3
MHGDDGLGFRKENEDVSATGVGAPPINPREVPNVEPVDVSSHIALNADLGADPGSVRRKVKSGGQGTQGNTRPIELVSEGSNGNGLGTDPTIMRMLEELTKRIESGEKNIEDNDKKVETYNSRVDKISGAPPILEGLDSKKFVQRLFPPSTAPKPIPTKFRMPEIPKYNGMTDPNEYVTLYTCAVKGNDLEDDEIEFVLLKKFGETLSKGALIWYHNLPPNSIDSFSMLRDSFVKAHARAIKIATRKSDLFKIRKKDKEMLMKFVSRFQAERMDLPLITDDWAIQAFTQGLNTWSSIASHQLKQSLLEYPAVTWADVHNRYQSKITVEEDELGTPSGSVYPSKPMGQIKWDVAREPRSNRYRYQPYNANRRSSGSGQSFARNKRRNNQGQNSRGFDVEEDHVTYPTSE